MTLSNQYVPMACAPEVTDIPAARKGSDPHSLASELTSWVKSLVQSASPRLPVPQAGCGHPEAGLGSSSPGPPVTHFPQAVSL